MFHYHYEDNKIVKNCQWLKFQNDIGNIIHEYSRYESYIGIEKCTHIFKGSTSL